MTEKLEMIVEKDVPIVVRDGETLRADVFRPSGSERHPVIMTYGPYGKDIHFGDFNAEAYALLDEQGPYMNWETVNPPWWVPQGYVVIRVDQRGTGTSGGRLELFGPQEATDYYDCIEWAGQQEWSTGRVGLLGISYYAINQWHVAALQPPHLSAIVPWEGAVDLYRDWGYHGGILSNVFTDAWWPRQVTGNQSALPPGADNPNAAVDGNAEFPADLRAHPYDDQYYADRAADLGAITVPVLSCGSWSGYALHLRGNIDGYLGAGSEHKWLEVHSGDHFTPFYTLESRLYQKDFLDRWLKDDPDAWRNQPPVKLKIRLGEGGEFRAEDEWPIARAEWTELHLDATAGSLSRDHAAGAATISYPAPDGAATFLTAPFVEDTEITGPIALHVWVSTTADDLDLFVTVIDLDQNGQEVLYQESAGYYGAVVKGWLRASHRQLDETLSTPSRPRYTHTAPTPVPSGEPFLLQVEVLPTSVVFRRGHRLGLVVGAADRSDPSFVGHTDPHDRSTSSAGTNVIHTGPATPSYLLVPVIPNRR